MPIIQQLDESSYAVVARGSRMVLEKTQSGWRMRTSNASTRVWSLCGESWKDFDTLEEVEARYKSWRGITQLMDLSG